jgi:flagellar basal-body rod protein FlgB
MPVSDLPIFAMLRSRMHWHQERQRVLAENVSNADTPNFRPKDLKPLDFGAQVAAAGAAGAATGGRANGQIAIAATDPAHITGSAGRNSFGTDRPTQYDVRPAGNAVNLEDEMMKVASNQMDYQAAISLYSRSMGLFRTALGKR